MSLGRLRLFGILWKQAGIIQKAVKEEGMKGWKTWTGAALIAGSAVLSFLGQDQIAQLVLTVGASLGLIGVAHKIEKAANGK